MSDIDTPIRRPGHTPGPWDPKPEDLAARETAPAPRPEGGALDKGQSPGWAVISTLLMGGFLWWITGSWVVSVAVVFGLFVHEYGHVLAMNKVGMGPARIYIIPFLGGLAKGQRSVRQRRSAAQLPLADGSAVEALKYGLNYIGVRL